MNSSRGITTLIIHCAATPNGRPFDIHDIDTWHIGRGFVRSRAAIAQHHPELLAVGYHYVITLDGTVQEGRGLDEVGAHAVGYNQHSIGLCLIGMDRFTKKQWQSLREKVLELRLMLPGIEIIGHRDINPLKTCPGFDVGEWLMANLQPLEGHVL